VRKKLCPQLRPLLQKLGPALIDEHGKDIQHAPGSNPSSGFSTPKYVSSSHISKETPKVSTSTTTTSSGKGPKINVTTINDEAEFRTTAEQLYKTFTEPDRIAAFTRSKPIVFEGAQQGGKFELFGGNVSGEYEVLEEPTKVVQKWRLSQWPQGHYATLNIRFEQNNVDAVTVMRVDIEGVPVGQEEVTKRNWGEYYVRSIKTTFGFGTVL
jgi:activator of HSP90 ATPase